MQRSNKTWQGLGSINNLKITTSIFSYIESRKKTLLISDWSKHIELSLTTGKAWYKCIAEAYVVLERLNLFTLPSVYFEKKVLNV